jgi:glutamate carboxypeptidase
MAPQKEGAAPSFFFEPPVVDYPPEEALMDFNLYFKSRQGEMVNLLKQIVSRESPTSEKKAVDACSAFVASEFRKAGAKVTRVPQRKIGDLHVIEFPASVKPPAGGQVLILTHVDTVWPVGKIDKMPFYISANQAFGPGVLDMKSGIVIVIFALKALHDLRLQPSRKVVVFINSAEEIGSPASEEMISRLARRSKAVFCLEPALPGGALKTQRKGRMVVRLEVKGRAAHAGTPEKGVNAIEELVGQIRRMKRLETDGVTLSVNQIGGGEKANVVAESAWAVADIRFWTIRQRDRILAALRQARPENAGAKFRFQVESQTPPMERTKASARLFQQAKSIGAGLEIALREGKTGGGSDASIASSLGVPTLDGLGPDGDGIHAESEHVLLPSFVERAALLTELLRQL